MKTDREFLMDVADELVAIGCDPEGATVSRLAAIAFCMDPDETTRSTGRDYAVMRALV